MLNKIGIRHVIMAICAVSLASLTLAFANAPYLPRLINEGFPAKTLPAAGTFAFVQGNDDAPLLPQTGNIGSWSRQLLDARGGSALLVYHAGNVEAAHYQNNASPQTKFNSYSMAKSLIGALVLRAVSEGKISTLEDPIGLYLPDLGDTVLRQQTILSFLQMRSGIVTEAPATKVVSGPHDKDLEETAFNPFGPLVRLHMSGLKAVQKNLQITESALRTFNYQNINTAILGKLLATIYGMPLQKILSEKIWIPAGAASAVWRQYDKNLPVTAYCCIYATATDWLKVGVFIMKNGTPEEPLLSQQLWQLYFGSDISDKARQKNAYGVHLFHNVLDREGETLRGAFSYMFGTAGQVIYMLPERDLVVVRLGDGIPLLHSTFYAAWRDVKPSRTN